MAVRAGLIGFGLAGRYFHAPLLQAAGIEIAAVVTSRAADVHSVLSDASVVASEQALLDEPAIDLIVIATPNHLHTAQAMAALRAGKHVVVDKPLSVTSAEASALADFASRRNRMLAVFQNRRWDSDFLTVSRLIR